MKTEYNFSQAQRGAIIPQPGKTRITIYIDDDILAKFREQAESAGKGYQTIMNEALRQHLNKAKQPLDEETLRRVIQVTNNTDISENPEKWYIQKQEIGTCLVISDRTLNSPENSSDQPSESKPDLEIWGPFNSQAEAIARRVGLIRTGKCLPIQQKQ